VKKFHNALVAEGESIFLGVFLFIFSFSRFLLIMQIWHIFW